MICSHHHDMVNRYGIYVLLMTTDMFYLSGLSDPFLVGLTKPVHI
jgi:hypothetical protein